MENTKIASMAVGIVTAYVANNRADADEVSSLLTRVGSALRTAANPAPPKVEEEAPTKRRIVRRRGGKVVGGDEGTTADTSEASEGSGSDGDIEDSDTSEKLQGNDASGGDDNFNEFGHPKRPEPMFAD